jgi:hypothetical protein
MKLLNKKLMVPEKTPFQGGDDGQTSTDGALVEEVATVTRTVGGSSKHVLPKFIAVRETLLVGSDDADALAQESRVLLCNVERAGVVDEDDLLGGGREVLDEGGGFEDGLVGVVEILLDGVDVQWAETFAEEDLL